MKKTKRIRSLRMVTYGLLMMTACAFISPMHLEASSSQPIAIRSTTSEPRLQSYTIENYSDKGFELVLKFTEQREITSLQIPVWKDGNKRGAKSWDATIQSLGRNAFRLYVPFSEIGMGTDYIWFDLTATTDGSPIHYGERAIKIDSVLPEMNTAVSTTALTNKAISVSVEATDNMNVIESIEMWKDGVLVDSLEQYSQIDVLIVYNDVNFSLSNPTKSEINLKSNSKSRVTTLSSNEVKSISQLTPYDVVIYDNYVWGASGGIFDELLNEFYEIGGAVVTTFDDRVGVLAPLRYGQVVIQGRATAVEPSLDVGETLIGSRSRFAEGLVGVGVVGDYHTMTAENENHVVLSLTHTHNIPETDGIVYASNENSGKWIHMHLPIGTSQSLLRAVDELAYGPSGPRQVYKESFLVHENGVYEIVVTDFSGNKQSETIVVNNIVSESVALNSSQKGDDGIQLDWEVNIETEDFLYSVFRSKNGAEAEILGNSKLRERVNVLNLHPNVGTIATYSTWDGESVSLPASANFKRWMEEPNAESDKGYGMGIIEVIPVPLADFNASPSDMLYKATSGALSGQWVTSIRGEEEVVDAIMVGSWDSNSGQQFNASSMAVVQSFIDDEYPVVFGHDTVREAYAYFWTFAKELALVGQEPKYNDESQVVVVGGGEVQSRRKGLIAEYPWIITEGDLQIPPTHSSWQMAKQENVWFNFSKPNDGYTPVHKEQLVEFDGYTNNHYLTINDNVALVQTGHSNGVATSDEQKILANTVFYLGQLAMSELEEQSLLDSMGLDFDAPIAPREQQTTIELNADGLISGVSIQLEKGRDIGTQYEYQVQAKGMETGDIILSNPRIELVESGMAGYSFVVDSNPTTIPDSQIELTADSSTNTTIHVPYQSSYGNEFYIHVKAIDNAGNESETLHLRVGDVNPPLISFYPEKTEPTNQGYILRATATDSESGLSGMSMPGSQFEQTSELSLIVEQNGRYGFQARDVFGNIAIAYYEVSNIDTEAPTVEISLNPDLGWTQQNTEVTISSSK